MRGPWLGIESFITTFYPSQDPVTIAGYSWTVVLDMVHKSSVPIDILPFLRILAQAPNMLCELIYPDNVPGHAKELEVLIWAIFRRWTRIVRVGNAQHYVHDMSGDQEWFVQSQQRSSWYMYAMEKVLLHPPGHDAEVELCVKREYARPWMTVEAGDLGEEEERKRGKFRWSLGLEYVRASVSIC
jgi:hypothetical protein